MPAARRRGLGSLPLSRLEDHARDHGVATLRLDTRRDLVEARRLYARHGYREVRPFSHGPYSDHWFEKTLPFGTGKRPAAGQLSSGRPASERFRSR
jgi:L-amino acid N-acyltransferase YncA